MDRNCHYKSIINALGFATFALLTLFCATPVVALDSSDLLFHLSFENGINPEFARGNGQPISEPVELSRRLVEGVLDRGYLFGGKGSTLEYHTGENGPRTCDEMYGLRANLFANSGTISFWLKHLPNSNTQQHDFVRFGDNVAYRDLYGVYYFNYAQKQGQLYNTFYPKNEWMNFTVTWRKGEWRSYLNGLPWGTVPADGVVEQTPERLILAAQGTVSAAMQKQESEDDTVMDEVQVFRRPLTEVEVRSIYERLHVVGKRCVGYAFTVQDDKPERPYAGHSFSAPAVAYPIKVDGDLSDWNSVPAQGCFIERRVGVLDDDPGMVYAASDAENLYLAFYCPVDDSIKNDPTHIKYPTGEFKASPTDRDGNIYSDDYVEFVLKGKDGHEYRFAVNAKGSLLDSRDGDKAWNADMTWLGRSDLRDWTVELALPLSQVGLSPGEIADFNVIRSWKLFKSSQNSLFANEACQPAMGKLTISAVASAAVSSLGTPWNGNIRVLGSIAGPAGGYLVKLHGRGLGQEFSQEQGISVGDKVAAFEISRKLQKPGDLALIVEVFDPAGKGILTRTIPFVFVGASNVELVDYPGWGKLVVKVTPLDNKDVRAAVSIIQDGKVLQTQAIQKFDNPMESVSLSTKCLEVGSYELLTQLYNGATLIGEDRQLYTKKSQPDWHNSKAGIIDRPPMPWTDVKVSGGTVKLLIKDIRFNKTLFPAQIVANGQSLLSGPVRVRVKRDGVEKVLTAGDFKMTGKTRRRADWVATAADGNLKIKVNGWIEFDGFTWMNVMFSGGTVDHIAVEVPLRRQCATLKTLDGKGLLGDKRLETDGCGSWFGNEKAGFQYWWEDQRGWVLNGEKITITPSAREVIISIPFVQQKVDLVKARTVTFGWAITPSKPLRKDWRYMKLNKKITYTTAGYCNARPNYPSTLPGETKETMQRGLDSLKKSQGASIVLWYAFGPFMWVGAPEYAEWWQEWRVTSWPGVPPNPNSTEWGWACHNSSGSDLFLSKLEKFVKEYPQRGIYVDCYFLMPCDNEAHGCGYMDENGVRQPSMPLLATRRHYERQYNIIKSADPVYGWVRIHDWGPIMPVAAFCDENWSGEGLIGPIGNTPEKNYYRVVDFPYARVEFGNEQWGHFQNWLTELGVYAGTDPKKREEWYGKMISPPKDGRHGEWILPRMGDYDHVAGLALIHDMWQIGGNDLGISALRLAKMQKEIGWDNNIRFYGYWELGDCLKMEGGIPEKIACSVYYKPASKDALGKPAKSWLLLAAMNNTDEDVTVTLRPNLKKFGLENLANGVLRDIYSATSLTHDAGFVLNPGDPEPPYIVIDGVERTFPMQDESATVTIAKRNFRALLLEEK